MAGGVSVGDIYMIETMMSACAKDSFVEVGMGECWRRGNEQSQIVGLEKKLYTWKLRQKENECSCDIQSEK